MVLPPVFTRSTARQSQRGVALVIVLSMVVLLAAIVVAFFSRAILDRQISSSSVGKVRADILAHSALDEVVADLRQEIMAGSTINSPAAGTPNADALTIYMPKPATDSASATSVPTLVPATGVGTANPTNIVKRSVSGQPFFAGANYDATNYPASNRASAVNSAADPSLDGRFISAARWNKPLLLDAARLGGDPGLSAPVYGNYFAAPDWVLVTRSGARPFAAWQDSLKKDTDLANSDYVVGRYSYVVYDEGGLIDINQAGFPSSLASDADFTTQRARLAEVDLTQIPGMSDPAIRETLIQSFRNQKTAASGTAYKDYILNGSPANPGLLRVMAGDQTLLSRQDLLNFQQQVQQQNAAAGTPLFDASALQYLGTFSRASTAPTWTPLIDAPAGGPYKYKTIASGSAGDYVPSAPDTVFDPATVFNRNLATLRFSGLGAAYTLPASTSGKIAARTVQQGEVVLNKRFPLSRLSWIGRDGPANGATAEDVKRAFGLTFNSTGIWTYTSPDGTAVASRIKTLNEIAARSSSQSPREPDFFELLQAGILHGSLGLSNAPNVGGDAFRTNADTRDIDRSKSRQIVQIGANIIDQYDADSYPTTILFKWFKDPELIPAVGSPYTPTSATDYLTGSAGLYQAVVGTEDLPQVYRIQQTYYKHPNLNPTGVNNRVGIFYFFELWNPHQPLSTGNGTGPRKVRIRVENGTSIFSYGQTDTGTVCASPYSFDPSTPGQGPQEIVIDLQQDNFRKPSLLTSVNSVGPAAWSTTNASPYVTNGNVSLIGGAWDNHNDNQYRFGLVFASSKTAPTFRLDYQNAAGQWSTYPYQLLPEYCWYYDDHTGDNSKWNVWYNNAHAGGRPDPRGVRWGFSENGAAWKIGATLNMGDGAYFGRPTYRPPTGAANDLGLIYSSDNRDNAYGVIRFNDWTNWQNGGGTLGTFAFNYDPAVSGQPKQSRYRDIDGIIRYGDSFNAGGNNPLDNTSPSTAPEFKPVVLNRPFRSVGELGFAYRDQPWKTIDFFTPNSADAALLDLFSVNENEITAGVVNLNTRQTPVLQAVISGALKKQFDGTTVPASDAQSLAQSLVTLTNPASPAAGVGALTNAAELSTRYLPSVSNTTAAPWVKIEREAAVRSLAEIGNTRVWNLMIDVIAQTGRYPTNATKLTQFNVTGEKRYWLHIALDRYTGKVIDQVLEPVSE